jgi:hypothetical protein
MPEWRYMQKKITKLRLNILKKRSTLKRILLRKARFLQPGTLITG